MPYFKNLNSLLSNVNVGNIVIGYILHLLTKDR